MIKNFKVTIIVALIFLLPINIFSLSKVSEINFRAIWVVRSSLVSKTQIDKFLDFVIKNNFNNIFIQVRGRGDAFYNSSFVPKSNLINDKNFDPLLYVLDKSKDSGIKVHIWLNVLLIWSSKLKPNDPFHIYNQYPDWIDKSSLVKQNVNLNNFQYLSPSHPEVKSYLKKILTELLLKYDFDGIHYDYIRYSDLDYGYNYYARELFKTKFNIDPINFSYDKNNSKSINLSNKLLKHWKDFRNEELSNLVKDLSFEIRKLKPQVIISAAVKPNIEEAKNRFYQDWSKWIIDRSIDYAVPMNYSSNNDVFKSNIKGFYNIFPLKIIMGIGVYNQTSNSVLDKIKFIKQKQFLGISFFSYDSQKENLEYFVPIVDEF